VNRTGKENEAEGVRLKEPQRGVKKKPGAGFFLDDPEGNSVKPNPTGHSTAVPGGPGQEGKGKLEGRRWSFRLKKIGGST